ncbi:hypothetical protein BC941DRAFT_465608 [Chlamydoabsidia padenii]|nr:hypothetical protein BC941DRAFT_465608 [Chlamydoabsidia padenii]
MPTFLPSSSHSPSTPTKTQHWLNNVTPLPRSSLSDSALPSRRVILRPNNSNLSTTSSINSSTGSIRPPRCVKPISSSSTTSTNDNNTNVNNGMQSFVNLFEDYSQKIYMEGYLMHQDKKYFVELCGTTLALWDIERPGEVVTPDYIPIMVDTKTYPSLRQQFTLELSHKKKNMVFDTLDPASLTKWICALHLARFERQLLNQFFTLRLFLSSTSSFSDTTCAGYMQVLLPTNKNEWKKLWVVVADAHTNNGTNTISRRSKFLHKQTHAPPSGLHNLPPSCPQFNLMESKKSKTPLMTLKRIDHAYAVYPESASLICQSTLIRVEGVQHDDQPMVILLMADSTKHMTQWLSTLYNAFKMYGRPDALVQDPMNSVALNFGEPNESNNCWLETDDITQYMDVIGSMDNLGIHQLLVNALEQKQSSNVQEPSTNTTSYTQQRANSLPLITVESIDTPRQRSTSDAGILNTRSALHSQIADSSDESDNNSSDDDDFGNDFDDDDDLGDADSDDEPIGKSKQVTSRQSSSSKNTLSPFLIPDFDFGNGFDTDRRGSSTNSSIMLSHGPSPTSSSTMTSHLQQQQQQPSTKKSSQHSSSGSNSTITTSSSNHSDTLQKRAPPSLFGDFSLTTDFSKYLDLSPDRKYSLPTATNVNKLYGNSKNRRNSAWNNDYDWDHRSTEDDYCYHQQDDMGDDYDQDGPLIPSLNDHFAPRNSLLDTHAGEQLSAKEQIEYARATGQPLIQVPSKPKPPKGGLVGVISQREMNRRQGNGTRVTERVNQHHANRFEREKERRILEQRQQQYMKHQIMMYTSNAANRYVHPMMMHSYQPPPVLVPGMMSPVMPYPPTPTSPSSFGRPYSPISTNNNPLFNQGSRPLDDEDEPLYSPYQRLHHPSSPL